jgi:hypothetical protein
MGDSRSCEPVPGDLKLVGGIEYQWRGKALGWRATGSHAPGITNTPHRGEPEWSRDRGPPKLIAFCGLMGSGKSFAAQHLIANHGFVRIRFAGPLKKMMKALGLSDEEIDGNAKELPCAKLGGKTPRHAMQTLGTEWGRELIDYNLWIDAWARQADAEMAAGWNVVCDDCRFLNEAAAVWARGGKLVKIERFSMSMLAGSHASERLPFSRYDRTIENSGDPEEFKTALDEMLVELCAGK